MKKYLTRNERIKYKLLYVHAGNENLLPDDKRRVSGQAYLPPELIKSRENEAERDRIWALNNVCPVCHMVKARNGSCNCD